MHQDKIGGITRPDPARVVDTQQLAASPGHRGQCLVRLQPRLDQLLYFQGQVARADGAAAEVRAGGDADAGAVRRLDGRIGSASCWRSWASCILSVSLS